MKQHHSHAITTYERFYMTGINEYVPEILTLLARHSQQLQSLHITWSDWRNRERLSWRAPLLAIAVACRSLQELSILRNSLEKDSEAADVDDAVIKALGCHSSSLRFLELDFLPDRAATSALASGCALEVVRINYSFDRSYNHEFIDALMQDPQNPLARIPYPLRRPNGGAHALRNLVDARGRLRELSYLLPLNWKACMGFGHELGLHREALEAMGMTEFETRPDLRVANDDLVSTLVMRSHRYGAHHLEVLQLDGCAAISGDSLPELVMRSKLQRLHLRHCPNLTAELAAAALRGDGPPCWAQEGVPLWAQGRVPTRWLRSLLLTDGVQLNDSVLEAIGGACPLLQQLELGMTGGDPGGDLDIFRVQHQITDHGVAALARLAQLDDLGIAGAALVTHAGLASVVGGCTQLRRLDLTRCESAVTEAGMAALGGARLLDRLIINYCESATPNVIGVITRCCPGLFYLSFTGCEELVIDNWENITSPDDPLEIFPHGTAWLLSMREQLPRLAYVLPMGWIETEKHPEADYPLDEANVTWRL